MIDEKNTDKKVRRLEKELLIAYLGLLSNFNTEDGELVYNEYNLAQTLKFDKSYKKFNKDFQLPFLTLLLNEVFNFQETLMDYYKQMGFENFAVAKKRIALLDTKVREYFYKFSNNPEFGLKIRSYIVESVAAHKKLVDFSKGFKDIITDSHVKYYKTFLYDTIMQYSRISDNIYADTFELDWFFYSGGLIPKSRKFCIKRNGKLFHRQDALDWAKDPTLPAHDFTYNPLSDLGLFNCRHILEWITEKIAKQSKDKLFNKSSVKYFK